MIGDVIRFVNKKEGNIIISGRTKHFLSLVGEHLSVDNMNKAVEFIAEKFNAEIPEFTVAGIPFEGTFAHQWYIGTDKQLDKEEVKKALDQKLFDLNDDYAVERGSALKDIFVEIVPSEKFYAFMSSKGKMGGQNKFPRVMKAAQLEEWKHFLSDNA
jgi:hypothetical protein